MVVVEEVVIPEDDVVYVGSLLDLQEQQETCMWNEHSVAVKFHSNKGVARLWCASNRDL